MEDLGEDIQEDCIYGFAVPVILSKDLLIFYLFLF